MSEREGKDNNKRCALLTDRRQRVREGKQSQGRVILEEEREEVREEEKRERKRREGRPAKRGGEGKSRRREREGVIAEVLGERKRRDWMKMRGECEEGEM